MFQDMADSPFGVMILWLVAWNCVGGGLLDAPVEGADRWRGPWRIRTGL